MFFHASSRTSKRKPRPAHVGVPMWGAWAERDTVPSCVRFLISFPPTNCHSCFTEFSSLISSTSLKSDIVDESMLHTCFMISWLPTIFGHWHVFGSQWSSDGVLDMLRFFFLACHSFMISVFLNRARVIVSIPHTFLQMQWFLSTGAHILFHFMRPPDHDLPVPKNCEIDNNPFWCRQIVARWCCCNLALFECFPCIWPSDQGGVFPSKKYVCTSC